MAAASKDWNNESKEISLNKKIAELKKRIILAGKKWSVYKVHKIIEKLTLQKVKRKQQPKNGQPKRKNLLKQ